MALTCRCAVGPPLSGGLADGLQKLSAPAAADALASMLTRDTAFKQLVLEAVDPNERMRLVVGLLQQVKKTDILQTDFSLSTLSLQWRQKE